MDVCPLVDCVRHLDLRYPRHDVLLQGRQATADTRLALEFALARHPGHPFWTEFVRRGAIVFSAYTASWTPWGATIAEAQQNDSSR
jgi:hypothetical protein